MGCIHASSSFALGLGELKLDSFLNEPLRAQVDLLNTDGLHADEIRIRLATREDFERMGVERAYFLTSIKFDVAVDAQGRGTISISSDDPVLEPYLDFIVEARWPSGRLLREYTVLVDPPLFDSSSPVASATQRVAEVEGTPLPDDGEKKARDPAATSGTRVDTKKSQLAPGEMPDRDFSAGTSGSPRSGARYMIHRDDTLWEIASAAKPVGASVHQTMLDIQRMNPDAFIDGNINRIKAGYIVYLPGEDDISSQDLAAALAEVKQQNEDWQAGRASKPIETGPKLRISADPVEESVTGAADAGGYTAGGAAAAEEREKAGLEQAAMAEELASMQQQVDTLQRIVNLKDDQIAALQAALEESGGSVDEAELAPMEGAEQPGADPGAGDNTADSADAGAPGEASEQLTGMVEPEPEPAPEPAARPAPAPAPAQEGGMMSYLLYGLGALLLVILGVVFVRRGKEDDSGSTATDDAFADVKLKAEPVAVAEPEAEQEPVVAEPEEELEPVRDNRGYGERKHDEYASDVETGDALAEADIYIAYGRYPQARDLLQNAINAEPGNGAYRLKLLETELQIGDRAAAEAQLRELEALGDSASVARGRELLSGGESFSEPPAGLADEVDSALETDFAGLEIEDSLRDDGDLEDDLDLSADFGETSLPEAGDDEDLVIAAEANGMSTKLDLARAYLDMGDEDGARQILEEVVAEGSEEQKAEAGALLERIG
ncbi:FimV family protein [Seongchinamella sediminis]|nr:FimV/HubP family polar landmark protein [Seongchinamella sediminis]